MKNCFLEIAALYALSVSTVLVSGNAAEPPVSQPSSEPKPILSPAAAAAHEINSFEKTGGCLTVAATGKWQNPVLSGSNSDAAKLKANPVLKVDIGVPPDAGDAGWFQVKLAIQGEGLARTESPKWLLERPPGSKGIDKATLSWDTSGIEIPKSPSWFKIEMVTQGDHPRTISVSNLRAEAAAGTADTAPQKVETPAPPAATTATPYPEKEQDWPGKGVIRKFGFMIGERNAIRARRDTDQGAVVFVGDSLTGGWKNLARDFPKLKVANCGVGGDVSRGVLFRFKEDVLDRNPKAIVIEIGNNDLTAAGSPSDMLSNLADLLSMVERQKPGTPVVLCSIPPSANPAAPVKAKDRQAMNEGIRKLAAEHKTTRFCDLYTATADAEGSPQPEYFVNDKLHLSDAGHVKWAELLTPILDQLKLP